MLQFRINSFYTNEGTDGFRYGISWILLNEFPISPPFAIINTSKSGNNLLAKSHTLFQATMKGPEIHFFPYQPKSQMVFHPIQSFSHFATSNETVSLFFRIINFVESKIYMQYVVYCKGHRKKTRNTICRIETLGCTQCTLHMHNEINV